MPRRGVIVAIGLGLAALLGTMVYLIWLPPPSPPEFTGVVITVEEPGQLWELNYTIQKGGDILRERDHTGNESARISIECPPGSMVYVQLRTWYAGEPKPDGYVYQSLTVEYWANGRRTGGSSWGGTSPVDGRWTNVTWC